MKSAARLRRWMPNPNEGKSCVTTRPEFDERFGGGAAPDVAEPEPRDAAVQHVRVVVVDEPRTVLPEDEGEAPVISPRASWIRILSPVVRQQRRGGAG